MHLPDDALEGAVARRAFGLAEEKLQVFAVEPPGDERVRGDVAAAASSPSQEMIGIVGQRAHSAGRDVQDVRLDPRAVRHAPADGAEPVDEGDPGRTPPAQEMGGDRDAAEAAADDGDRKRRRSAPRW